MFFFRLTVKKNVLVPKAYFNHFFYRGKNV